MADYRSEITHQQTYYRWRIVREDGKCLCVGLAESVTEAAEAAEREKDEALR